MTSFDVDVAHAISARPGYFVLELLTGDGGIPYSFRRLPVVGWALETEIYTPCAITLEGIRVAPAGIERPDGVVERPDVQSHDGISDWFACVLEEYAEFRGIDLAAIEQLRREQCRKLALAEALGECR